MNVIISNKNQAMLENLGIDVIKEMNGEFDVDEIIATFQNFFYQRMILDITAIKNYTDIVNLQKLSMALDMEKVILLLDGTDATCNPNFLSNLVSMGIYNFAKNFEGIQYLYNSPNSYRDVAQFHRLDATFANANMQQQNPQAQFISPTIDVPETPEFYGTRIIGVKNITKQSGASSLVYMMVKELSKNYSVVGIEVDKNDFTYFKDKRLISTITSDIGVVINKNKDKNIIIVDINNSMVAEGFCQEVLYLIEPSMIKLNKLMFIDRAGNSLKALRNKKVILNQSLLNQKDVLDFEYESGLKIFYNMPPLDEEKQNTWIIWFLIFFSFFL